MISAELLKVLYPAVFRRVSKKKQYSWNYLCEFCVSCGATIEKSRKGQLFVFTVNDVSFKSHHEELSFKDAIYYALELINNDISNKKKPNRQPTVA